MYFKIYYNRIYFCLHSLVAFTIYFHLKHLVACHCHCHKSFWRNFSMNVILALVMKFYAFGKVCQINIVQIII